MFHSPITSSDEISDSEELEDLAPCEEDEEDVEEELNYSDDYEKVKTVLKRSSSFIIIRYFKN